MQQPVTVTSCTNKSFSSKSTYIQDLIPILAGVIAFIPTKVGIKPCRCVRECFICTCTCLSYSYRLVHYSYIVISNWFKLTSCFLTFCWNPYFLSQIWIFLVYLVNILLCTEELTCYEVRTLAWLLLLYYSGIRFAKFSHTSIWLIPLELAACYI